MLTATYALVALSAEHARVRVNLAVFRNATQGAFKSSPEDASGWGGSMLTKLNRLQESSYFRKVEIYLIPELRKVTKKADLLIAELESLSLLGVSIFRSIRDFLKTAMVRNSEKVSEKVSEKISEISDLIEIYCNTLQERLEKEEKELFVLARRVISIESWFALARQFLSHDAANAERARSSLPVQRKVRKSPVVPQRLTGRSMTPLKTEILAQAPFYLVTALSGSLKIAAAQRRHAPI